MPNKNEDSAEMIENDRSRFGAASFARFFYRHRWTLAVSSTAFVLVAFGTGVNRLGDFSDRVTSLDETPPEGDVPPRLFDPRTDIWFDPEDTGIRTYYAIEDQFVAEDVVSIAFEDTEDPWGVFGVEALSTIARVTERIERVPNVRNVRSLTTNPWIRWGEAGPAEEGLVIGDLFEEAPASYSDEERLARMIAVLGAERAANLVGDEVVRAHLGSHAEFDEHIGEPRLMGAVVSEDGKSAALLVQILRPRAPPERVEAAFSDDPTGAELGPTIRVMEQQRDAIAAIEALLEEEDGYAFHLAGLPLFEREFLRVGQSDMVFVALMFGLIGLVLLLIYRRPSAVAIPLVVVFTAVLAMMGLVWAGGDLINNLTAIAPVMITAIGIADAVHLVTAYFLLRPGHDDKAALITAVLTKNALPVLLTSITTAVGFFSLVTSELSPIRQLGYTAGLGTIAAYVLSMTLVPALLSLLPLPEKPSGEQDVSAAPAASRSRSERWIGWVESRRGVILVSTVVLAAVAAVGLGRIHISSDIRLMFPEDNAILRDLYWTEARIGGGSDLDIVFYGPERLDEIEEGESDRSRIATSAEFLAQVDAFQRRVEEEARDPRSPLRVLTNFDSALAVLRKVHQVQNENQAAFYRVPTEADVPPQAREARILYDDVLEETIEIPGQNATSLVAQYYVQFENGAKPSENLSPLVTADRRGFRIAARTRTDETVVLLAAFARLRQILRTEFPGLAGTQAEVASGDAQATVMFSGKQYLFTNMFELFSNTLVVSLAIALLLITLLIALVYRSAAVAAVSLIPNVLPLVIPLGLMGLLGLPLDGPAVLVVTVALGVCVDDTIHFLTKYTEGRKAGLGVPGALAGTLSQVGAAITFTTIILTIGFGALAFSDFRPNMLIGVLGATMIGLAWFADFLVTPALLSFLDRSRATNRVTTPPLTSAPAAE